MSIITRFAPSPTGLLHIGGARTALYNYLYAKKNKGIFRLRIEDTDKDRSKEFYSKDIIQNMKWLGLFWDGDIIYQSKNQESHIRFAEKLLSENKAYKCYTSKEEIEVNKEKANKENKPYKYDRKWRTFEGSLDKPYVVRVKIPLDQNTVLYDKILGKIVINNNELEDFIILRSDKTPTYMLSVVADDYAMGVTDVIRGDDHLTNTFKQLILYNLLNFKKPTFSHIPLIHSQEGGKLSKRHGDQSVKQYQEKKFLPDALLNYLLRLGWGYKDKEFFSLQEAISLFNLNGVGKSPAKFDEKKLTHLNSYYFKKLTLAELKEEIGNHYNIENISNAYLNKLIVTFQERSESLNDFTENIEYMFKDDVVISEQARNIIMRTDKDLIKTISNHLSNTNQWEEDNIEKNLKNIAQEKKLKLFNIASPIRALVTGKVHSPSIFKILYLLGKEKSLKRIKKSF